MILIFFSLIQVTILTTLSIQKYQMFKYTKKAVENKSTLKQDRKEVMMLTW
jgi:hypothetical protein